MSHITFRPKDRERFRIGNDVGQLWEGDTPITVRPKQWQLLRYLAERPGKTVLKTVLLDDIWGKDVAVQPQIVDQTLTGLRQRLGDTAKGSRFIETVSGGLRFVADIVEAGLTSQETPEEPFKTTSPGDSEATPRSDVSVSINIGYFGNGWHSKEFVGLRDAFLEKCFESGYHNCDSFDIGGPFSVVRYWQVPLNFAEEVKAHADQSLLARGVTCDVKLVHAPFRSDGSPHIIFIVGSREMERLTRIGNSHQRS